MAGAAVIVAVTNALDERDFPFVFGGDGASFAVPADGRRAGAPGARRNRDLGEGGPRSHAPDRHGAGRGNSRAGPRRPRRPLRAVGEHLDCDVLGRRHGLGRRRDEARRDRGASRRRPARIPTSPACRAATRKSRHRAASCCRWWWRRARTANTDAFRAAIEKIARIVEKTPDASRPVPGQRLRLTWPPAGADLEARASRRAGEPLWQRKIKVLALDAVCVPGHALQHHGRRFIPAKYTRELIDNSDFRKFDDSLRMVLDCTPALANEIEQHLAVLRRERHRALRHAPPARGDDDVLHAVADPLQPRAFHRRRDGRLCDGGERDEGRARVDSVTLLRCYFRTRNLEGSPHEQSHRPSSRPA